MGLLERAPAVSAAKAAAAASRQGDFLVEWRPLAACAGIEAQWTALAEAAAEPNVFHEPGFMLPAARHLRDAAGYGAILVWRTDVEADELVGFWPMRGARRPLKIARGFQCRYASSGAPLLHRGFAVEAATAMISFALAREPAGSGLMFPEIALEGPAARALRAAAALSDLASVELGGHLRACLWQGDGHSQLADTHHLRKRIKAMERKLAEHGPVTGTLSAEVCEVKRDLEYFLALEASGWKARRGTAILADARDSAFYRMMIRQLARAGKAEVHSIEAGGRIAAAGVVLRSGEQSWYVKTAHDEELADASPGALLGLAIGRSRLSDPAVVLTDSCALPGAFTIERIWKGRIRIGDLVIGAGYALPEITSRELMRRRARSALKSVWYAVNGWPMK